MLDNKIYSVYKNHIIELSYYNNGFGELLVSGFVYKESAEFPFLGDVKKVVAGLYRTLFEVKNYLKSEIDKNHIK